MKPCEREHYGKSPPATHLVYSPEPAMFVCDECADQALTLPHVGAERVHLVPLGKVTSWVSWNYRNGGLIGSPRDANKDCTTVAAAARFLWAMLLARAELLIEG
jgi:hypothetical protein